jgi:hypothetical protein
MYKDVKPPLVLRMLVSRNGGLEKPPLTPCWSQLTIGRRDGEQLVEHLLLAPIPHAAQQLVFADAVLVIRLGVACGIAKAQQLRAPQHEIS